MVFRDLAAPSEYPSSDWKVAREAKLADGASLGAARTDNEELPKREAAIRNLEVPHETATLDLLSIGLRYDMITSGASDPTHPGALWVSIS
jgi:hypothetical protein